jgi:hypothetical protein
MKRIRILGLCLMVACAFAAVSVASSASAAEFGQCLAAKKAEFNNSTCTEKSAKAHKGHFEFYAADSCIAKKKGEFNNATCTEKSAKAHKGHFEAIPSPVYTTSSGPAELITPGFGAVKCSASSGGGAITGGKTTTTQTSFTGCETSGQKCQNTATEGNIVTFPLTGNLTEPTTGKAETVLTPTSGKYLAFFGCTGVAFIRTGGSVGGNNTPVNTQGTTTSFNFESGVEQHLETEFSSTPTFEPGTVLGPFASEQVGVFTLVGSPAEEIKVN